MIKIIQLQEEIDNAISELLKKGIIPTYQNVMNIVDNKFTRGSGLPIFIPKYIPEYSVSSPQDIQDMFNCIYRDLAIGFKETRYQDERILSMLNGYYIERKKLWSEINKQNALMNSIKQYMEGQSDISSSIIINTFSDFIDVNFNEDVVDSIPATDCFIDLKQQKIYTWRNRKRIDISTASIDVLNVNYDDGIQNKWLYYVLPPENSLTDFISDRSLIRVISEKTKCRIETNIVLNNPVNANSITMSLMDGNTPTISLYLSADGVTYTKKAESIVSNNKIEWSFNDQDILSIKFEHTKNNPDGIGNDNQYKYEFYFGVENISVYKDTYTSSGTFCSNEYTITDAKAIVLDTTEILYTGSSIRYYIIFHKGNDIEWKEIESIKDNDIGKYKLLIPDSLLTDGKYTGKLRLVAKLHTDTISAQLFKYAIIPIAGG